MDYNMKAINLPSNKGNSSYHVLHLKEVCIAECNAECPCEVGKSFIYVSKHQ